MSLSSPTQTKDSLATRLWRVQELGVLVALLLLCAYLAVTTKQFSSPVNLLQVARQASYYGIMAVGMVFVISMGEIDLSVGSIYTLANIAAAMALRGKLPAAIAILIGLGVGALCGLINGLLSVTLKIPTIIVTLGTLSAYRGFSLMLSDATPISQFSKDQAFFTIGGGNVLSFPIGNGGTAGIPISVIAMFATGIVGWIVITRTIVGRRISAIGSSPATAHLSGISIRKYKVGVMTANGIIAAFAGMIALAYLEAADPSSGQGFELWVIASVIIGGTALSGGRGSVPGAILGSLIIAVIGNGLVLKDASAYASTAVTGIMIILAVSVDAFVKRRAEKRA